MAAIKFLSLPDKGYSRRRCIYSSIWCRSVRVDGVKFLINEKTFYFKGYGKYEDTFPNGRGINLPMNTKDISIMKWQMLEQAIIHTVKR